MTHISHIRSVADVRSQNALEQVVVRTPLKNKSLKLLCVSPVCVVTRSLLSHLLEDTERVESSGNVLFDELQTGLSVSQRRFVCR